MALRKRYEAQEAREPPSPGGSIRRDHERWGSGGAQEGLTPLQPRYIVEAMDVLPPRASVGLNAAHRRSLAAVTPRRKAY